MRLTVPLYTKGCLPGMPGMSRNCKELLALTARDALKRFAGHRI